ncbi:hypothetical protein, partial [Lacticaseibacillus rhamnosus]|uniref:hypothetical protein n=1 Tax=Lacticaseibacillus rhamnosus TaxID=47715 RepID=UPI00232DE28A
PKVLTRRLLRRGARYGRKGELVALSGWPGFDHYDQSPYLHTDPCTDERVTTTTHIHCVA